MTSLSSSKLRDEVISAGIKFIPADQIFYREFPYKVTLSPKYKGLGGVTGKKGCQIDVSNPEKARIALEAFNKKIMRHIENSEERAEILEFVDRLPEVEYKRRIGGENNLFYFRESSYVSLICSRYKSNIESVTGPINDTHEHAFDENNIVTREKLYYGKFRYMLKFKRSIEFVDDTFPKILSVLEDMDPETYRTHKFHSLQNNYPAPIFHRNGPVPFYSMTSLNNCPTFVQLYLSSPEEYVYLKLLAGQHITDSHELKLFSELS